METATNEFGHVITKFRRDPSRQCRHKAKLTEQEADTKLASLLALPDVVAPERLNKYRCPHGQHWHVGHVKRNFYEASRKGP
jgi:hypothetical protein